MQYSHLTQGERYQISAFKKAGLSIRSIAATLDRSPSTVSREILRNSTRPGYLGSHAHQTARIRRSRACSHPRITWGHWRTVELLVRKDWSPQQVSMRCRLEGSVRISHEWIYNAIYADKAFGGSVWWQLRQRKTRRKRYGGRSRRGQIPGRVGIQCRPAGARNRSRLGHWEGDTVHGGLGGVVTLVDRKARFVRIAKVTRRTAARTRNAIRRRLLSLGLRIGSVTFDNGSEFSDHVGISEDIGAGVYFADPYSSWQRGTNENTNGLIRQYLPKGRDLADLTGGEIRKIEDRLNHRPRKCLGYRTPYEVLYGVRHKLTVALRS